MKIVIVNTFEPFAFGGAERLALSLEEAFKARGHDATLLRLPFCHAGRGLVLDRMRAMSDLSLRDPHVDMVVGLKFPAYLVQHPRKVLWVLHQYRQAYELYERGVGGVATAPDGEALREAVVAADNAALGAARSVQAISGNVADRMRRYNGVEASVLYPPVPDGDGFERGAARDYLLWVGRPDPLKRADLALRALALTAEPVRLTMVVSFLSDGPYRALQGLAVELGVAERVDWRPNVTHAEKLRLYSEALGIVFVPVDEDYGYVTLEAMASAKPVVTATDAGGPLEFVADGETGLVTAPEAEDLAMAMDRLWQDRASARRMGEAGRDRYADLGLDWGRTVDRLVDAAGQA